MRVLFVATPLIGHAFPMLPLALRLRAAGHEVLLGSGDEVVTVLRDRLPTVTVADPMSVRVPLRALALHPLAARHAIIGSADPMVAARVFAAVNDNMLRRVLALSEQFAPDLIVHEPFAAVAAIAADRLKVPAVLHNIGLDHGELVCARLLERLGEPEVGDTAALSIAPPSIVSIPGWPMRYIPFSTPGPPLPDWLETPGDRPRILVTRSTMLGDRATPFLRSVVRAAPDVDAEFVIVRPDRGVTRHPALPANIRTVGWTVLADALRTCDAMINHGGAGSVYAALNAGLPQILTPDTGDRGWNAELIHARGCGLSVAPRRITAEHITRLIDDRALAKAAREVAAEISAMPSPDELFPRLEGLADFSRD
ncbi:nucleotide disphospho-sugar-binding domain-containing protein [Nocardia sp. CDC153]|uniref:glycosyltransferase n=1 Tax=Nocardia sp. CDC153 TaxID=3112167 RepID=UPI002DC037DC|nr:nucleotide disphospho-sugar-binding domain-containing protein [Nocardia sp. CDC153]MEC3954093.1 nucleotide disphospho-sugar-binding domain-containing protein [Nocardia sp. CDC153]